MVEKEETLTEELDNNLEDNTGLQKESSLHEEPNVFEDKTLNETKSQNDEDEDESDEWLASRADKTDESEESIEEEPEEEPETLVNDDKVDLDTSELKTTDFSKQIVKLLNPRKLRKLEPVKIQLNEPVQIQLQDINESVSIDWTGVKLKISHEDCKAACKIKMTKKDFDKLVSGKLNPQIGMLSENMKIEGKVGLAVYVFNLFV